MQKILAHKFARRSIKVISILHYHCAKWLNRFLSIKNPIKMQTFIKKKTLYIFLFTNILSERSQIYCARIQILPLWFIEFCWYIFKTNRLKLLVNGLLPVGIHFRRQHNSANKFDRQVRPMKLNHERPTLQRFRHSSIRLVLADWCRHWSHTCGRAKTIKLMWKRFARKKCATKKGVN